MTLVANQKWRFAIFLLCFTLFSFRKLQLLPPYSHDFAKRIVATAKEVDRFYLSILETLERLHNMDGKVGVISLYWK